MSNKTKEFLTRFETSLDEVTDKADSIQTISQYVLAYAKTNPEVGTIVVDRWSRAFKRSEIKHRLVLFYLANDIIQNGKRKGFKHFQKQFEPVLAGMVQMFKDSPYISKISRVLDIWAERGIFDKNKVSGMRSALAGLPIASSTMDTDAAVFDEEAIQKLPKLLEDLVGLEIQLHKSQQALSMINIKEIDASNISQITNKADGQVHVEEWQRKVKKLESVVLLLQNVCNVKKNIIVMCDAFGGSYVKKLERFNYLKDIWCQYCRCIEECQAVFCEKAHRHNQIRTLSQQSGYANGAVNDKPAPSQNAALKRRAEEMLHQQMTVAGEDEAPTRKQVVVKSLEDVDKSAVTGTSAAKGEYPHTPWIPAPIPSRFAPVVQRQEALARGVQYYTAGEMLKEMGRDPEGFAPERASRGGGRGRGRGRGGGGRGGRGGSRGRGGRGDGGKGRDSADAAFTMRDMSKDGFGVHNAAVITPRVARPPPPAGYAATPPQYHYGQPPQHPPQYPTQYTPRPTSANAAAFNYQYQY